MVTSVQVCGTRAVLGHQPQIYLVGLGPERELVHLETLEGGTHLIGDGAGVQAQHPGPRLEPQAKLPLAGAQVIGEVVDPDEAIEPGLKLIGRQFEALQVVAQQTDIDRPAAGAQIGFGVLDGNHVGQIAHLFAPAVPDLLQGGLSAFGPQQVDGNPDHVGAGLEGIRILAVDDSDVAHQVLPPRLAWFEVGR